MILYLKLFYYPNLNIDPLNNTGCIHTVHSVWQWASFSWQSFLENKSWNKTDWTSGIIWHCNQSNCCHRTENEWAARVSFPSVSLPCRSDDSARTCRPPLTHNPPALYSCFSWTYLHLSLKQSASTSWEKLLFAPHPERKTDPRCFPERSQRRTIKTRSALLVISAGADRGGCHLKQLIHSERCQELEGSSFFLFFFSFFLFSFLMTRTVSSVFGVCLVRFYAGSTTWISNRRPSHMSCHGTRGEGVVRLVCGQCKRRAAHSCKIMQLFPSYS